VTRTRRGRTSQPDGGRAYRNPAIPDNPNLMRLFSLRELAEKTGLPPRGLQFWMDHGLIECDAPDARTGRGVHRYYRPVEVQIASLLAPLAAGEMPVGVLQKFAAVFRAGLTGEPLSELPSGLAVDDWRELSRVIFRAARGEGVNFLVIPYFPARPSNITVLTDEDGRPLLDVMAVYPCDYPEGFLHTAGSLIIIEMTSRLAPLFA
jgi:hypothetical protein